MADIIPGRRYVTSLQRRDAGGSGAKFVDGDTLMARISPCLENGKIAQFRSRQHKPAFGSTEFWVLRARPGISDPGFVFYLAYSNVLRGPAEKSMVGASGRQRADAGAIGELEVSIPSLLEQQRIASILSAYDDLIENNTRRITILEEMARRLYEEWFIRFRFPGHEGVPMVESELGLMPQGWAVVAASQAIQINPTTKVPKDGLKPFLAMNCLSNGSMLIDNPSERDGNSGAKFRNGDTLFARITPCLENGKTGFVQFLPTDEAVGSGRLKPVAPG